MTNVRVSKISQQVLSVVCVLLLLPAAPLLAQGTAAPPPDAYPPAQAGQVPPQASAPLLNPQQLDNLVAPVALYPDALLGQLLAASTYPLEIVEAAQWLQQNPNLRGMQLIDAAKQQNWDPSVQAMVMFPDVLNRLNSNIRWTTDLGNAFLAQQPDVMNAVQRMRAQAQANGRLNSNAQETVTTQNQGDQTAIQIAPTNPDVVYVPEYNPDYIWGPPAWGYYPPLYYPAVGFGFGFYPGIYLGGFFGGLGWGGWGWGCNWFGGSLYTNAFFFNHYGFGHWGYGGFYRGGFNGGAWSHDPGHRLGVAYPNRTVAARFGGNARSGFANRAYSGAGGGGFSHFGQPAANGQRALSGNQNGGWSHFGQPGAAAAPRSATNQFRGSAPQSFSRPQTNAYRSAPSSNFAARPAPSYRSTPSFGGGGSRSFGGGGSRSVGGGFHGGGGGGSHGGGGGHGGGHR